MKLMLIGRTGSGKTTLTQRINNSEVIDQKTQMTTYEGKIIDTPGEYIENKGYYGALNVISCDADVIGLVQASTDDATIFPPNFATMFTNKRVIGIITKVDLQEDIEKAERFLENAGVHKIYLVGKEDENTIEQLKNLIGSI
ncbi:EutP/PduV family microcompartment system protein [Cetobacterium sp. 2A]|uniref:EutP/PduV family microcompartment system protein n=1 Tax=unclassified Cetobacterium TaxID=2630983 RepID=UPI00163C2E25|nr:EutP/PduV family microcompartment system protein [Cetobacterium sp. 2A]MBC2855061.1 EutP/PduV family microcompartment system protein [Cetobacterium sp. 2A]